MVIETHKIYKISIIYIFLLLSGGGVRSVTAGDGEDITPTAKESARVA